MKPQNKRPKNQIPHFNPKKSPLDNHVQAALFENEPSIQEMQTVIFLAELVKSLENHHEKQ